MTRRCVHVCVRRPSPNPQAAAAAFPRPIISRPRPNHPNQPPPHSLLPPLLLLAAVAAHANAADTPSNNHHNLRRQATWDPLTLAASTDRPARVVLPASYYDEQARRGADAKRNYPVLMVLHGWGSSGKYVRVCGGVAGRLIDWPAPLTYPIPLSID